MQNQRMWSPVRNKAKCKTRARKPEAESTEPEIQNQRRVIEIFLLSQSYRGLFDKEDCLKIIKW